MAVLISKMQERIERLEIYVSSLEKENQIQYQIIENYKKMMTDYERHIDILEELLRRAKNETLAQGPDQLSSAAAGDISVAGAVSDSGTSSEGSHA